MRPPKFRYTAASAGEGAVTALAVTGAEVASTVTAGTTAAVAFGAVAVDSVASMAIMGRTIGAVATRYGYDVGLPEEELFAMGVLSLGLASSMGAKTQALAALSRLAQEMVRQATWTQLNEHVLVPGHRQGVPDARPEVDAPQAGPDGAVRRCGVERGTQRTADRPDVPASPGGLPSPGPV